MTPSASRDAAYGPPEGRVRFGAYLYCVITGVGVGAFTNAVELGTAIGLFVAVVAGEWVVPPLAREWREHTLAPASVRLNRE